MKESVNSMLSELILNILKKGEYSTGDIQSQIRLRHKEVYHNIDQRTDKTGKKSPFSKYVDGALQSLKRKGKVERVLSDHGSPWRLTK